MIPLFTLLLSLFWSPEGNICLFSFIMLHNNHQPPANFACLPFVAEQVVYSGIYYMFFTKNSCLLLLSTRLMRVKQNCKVVGCEIFFFFKSAKVCSAEEKSWVRWSLSVDLSLQATSFTCKKSRDALLIIATLSVRMWTATHFIGDVHYEIVFALVSITVLQGKIKMAALVAVLSPYHPHRHAQTYIYTVCVYMENFHNKAGNTHKSTHTDRYINITSCSLLPSTGCPPCNI